MAVFSRIKTWVSNEVLTAADLNGEFNNILNNMDPEGIEDASASVSDMQATTNPGGSGSESLATDLLGEIKRLRYVVQRIVGTYWYTDPTRYLTAGGLNVQTADIAAGAVTRAKLESLGQQISSSSGTFSTASASLVDVTNLTVTITTTGRPVYISVIPDGTANNSVISYINTGASGVTGICAIIRDSTLVGRNFFASGHNGSTSASLQMAPSVVNIIDTPAAGTYVYKIQTAVTSGTSAGLQYSKLIAYEL
jgi:hypothetical protein